MSKVIIENSRDSNGVVLDLSLTSILFISVVGKFRPNIEFTPFHDFLISPRFVSKYLL